MPSKNVNKLYLEDSYYHIYNRGVEKRIIFEDQQDYGVFLSYLKEYLLPKDTSLLTQQLANPSVSYKERDKIIKLLHLNNFSDNITLLAYCLMPNHFHFIVKQKHVDAMDKFMNSLGTRYTMYFNHKYKRVGGLYQDVYKAVLVNKDEQLIHLSWYIHNQALVLNNKPSSYPEYVGLRNTKWIDPADVLAFFSETNPKLSYKSFMEEKVDISTIYNIIIEE